MHPIVILIPTAALILGPRLWVGHVLKQHNQKAENLPGTAAELARQWLDQNQLQHIALEKTDVGDHYDPEAKAVRLTRDKFDSKSLTAITTAAHEVSHAVQDAVDYAPFVWRNWLAKLALTTGQIGTIVLLTVPLAAHFSQRPLPGMLISSTLVAIMGSGLATQLAALTSELDASFKRALPMLQSGTIEGQQIHDAKKILVACSLTYVASSLLSVLHIWPWFGPARFATSSLVAEKISYKDRQGNSISVNSKRTKRIPTYNKKYAIRRTARTGMTDRAIRLIGKPIIRTWFRLSRGVVTCPKGGGRDHKINPHCRFLLLL